MWQWIEFTPEEARALEAADREMAGKSWEELGIPPLEGGVPPKKKRTRRRRRDIHAASGRG